MASTSQVATLQAAPLEGHESYRSESLTRKALRRLRRDYLTLGAMAVILTMALLAFTAPLITSTLGISYTNTEAATAKFLPIGAPSHPLGTDSLGRDHLARLLYGGRVSLGIAVSASLFSTCIGVSIGLIAGFYQGGTFKFIDDFIMWVITTLNSIPTLLLLLIISYLLPPSVGTLIMVLTIVSWTGVMRLVRGETMANREREYVISARAVGASPVRIMFVHILPNVLSIIITALAIEIGTLILVESALSFLGVGVRPPEPSWGNMLTGAQSFLRQGPHLSIIPGFLIFLTVLSFYLVGDGLRDAFDPHSTK